MKHLKKISVLNTKHVLAGLVLSLVILLIGYILYNIRIARNMPVNTQHLLKLPPDVDGVMHGYILKNYSNDCRMEIKGRSVVKRGKKMLGLRVNMLKTCFFEDISGSFYSKRGITRFSAEEAEWDMNTSNPLQLSGEIRVNVSGKEIKGARRCDIYLKSGLIEVIADHTMIFHFK